MGIENKSVARLRIAADELGGHDGVVVSPEEVLQADQSLDQAPPGLPVSSRRNSSR